MYKLSTHNFSIYKKQFLSVTPWEIRGHRSGHGLSRLRNISASWRLVPQRALITWKMIIWVLIIEIVWITLVLIWKILLHHVFEPFLAREIPMSHWKEVGNRSIHRILLVVCSRFFQLVSMILEPDFNL